MNNRQTLDQAFRLIEKLKTEVKLLKFENKQLKGSVESFNFNDDLDLITKRVNLLSSKINSSSDEVLLIKDKINSTPSKNPKQITEGEIIDLIRDTITITFVNKLYGRK